LETSLSRPLFPLSISCHLRPLCISLIFFTTLSPPTISPLSLHDALPISDRPWRASRDPYPTAVRTVLGRSPRAVPGPGPPRRGRDRKSTRLNSSHVAISYAVFCLKKKRTILRLFRFLSIWIYLKIS